MSTARTDYSHTVNLPRTAFPMRANLVQREPEILREWTERKVYWALRERRRGAQPFILHDGPPYSNEHIHLGTALNKIVKDFIVRTRSMLGYDAPFTPGWDNHGMPIELEILRQFRREGREPTVAEMRRRCRDYAARFVEIQREEFIRLGIWGDWENPYLTMSPSYEASVLRVFADLAEQGQIYRGLRPIHWCPSCETALAESEIEYRPRRSPSITVRFPLRDDPRGIFPAGERGDVWIWTTTPWTIPANLAVVVHPDLDYVLARTLAGVSLLAARRAAAVLEGCGIASIEVVRTLRGSELEGLVFSHPLVDRPSPLFLAAHVTLEEGTGIVHTAPGHGMEDFLVGQREGLPPLCPIDARGRFTGEAGRYAGLSTEEANPRIVADLAAAGALVHEESIEHQYPHCWRCKGPLLFRTTVQWFLSIDHRDLRQRTMAALAVVRWDPEASANRIAGMIASRPDWCLSRQRLWGVGIPILYCAACREPLLDGALIRRIADAVAEAGADTWFERPAGAFAPPGLRCRECGEEAFTKETDILDVWFESGSSHRAVLRDREGVRGPADLYYEGSDQHRGWFNTSLLLSMATTGEPPYRQVCTHGWVLDAEGKAMHKSAGNVVNPLEVVGRSGADVLRLWVAANDFRSDVRFSWNAIEQAGETYFSLRNTCRFLLGNLYDFDPSEDACALPDMWEIDRYALHCLAEIVGKVRAAYEAMEFHQAYHLLNSYCAVTLSALYLDVCKDRLYTFGSRSRGRRSAQTALAEVLEGLARLLAPLCPFSAEEIWRAIPWGDRSGSVHFEQLPVPPSGWHDAGLARDWERLLRVREEVARALEGARARKEIGKSLEAAVEIAAAPGEWQEVLARYLDDLPMVFIVSQVTLRESDRAVGGEGPAGRAAPVEVTVRGAAGAKCQRCWNYRESVGQDPEDPGLCARCLTFLREERHDA